MKNARLIICFLVLVACKDNPPAALEQELVTVEWANQQLISREEDGVRVFGVLALPGDEQPTAPVPAVIIMHGSGGMWVDNAAGGTMAKQFRDWADSLRENGMAALFIDSYSVRGIEEFHEVPPPDNAVAAAEYVRPRDAYAALAYLRKARYATGTAVIDPDNVFLLGFSHGGTSVLAAVVDTEDEQIKSKTKWTQQSNGETYPALPPVPRPAEGGFRGVISYYPGCGFYRYFGSVQGNDCMYVNYCPVLILAAENDALYTGGNTEGLADCAQRNGGDLRLEVMEDANHSFDGKTTGSDGAANIRARTIALDFIRQRR